MRVLHIYHDFAPTRGGVEDYLADLTREQVRLGWAPVVLTANPLPYTCVESLDGVQIIRAPSFGRYFTPFCPGWFLWVRRIRADVLHLHLPCPLGEWVMWLMHPRRLVVSLHNDYVRPRLALKLHRPIHGAVLGRADAVIVAAPDYARTSSALGEIQAKVRIVPYGIDLAKYQHASPTKHGCHESYRGRQVLFVGRLCYYKGVEVLLDAAPTIDACFVVIGDGAWRKRLSAQAKRNAVDGRVVFLGAVTEDRLIEQMHAAAVFVFPSTERSEAFGIAQLKAMACGLPVASSNLPGVGWLNRHGETGLTVPVRDAPALARAINLLLSDEPLRQRLARGARERAGEFPLARMVKETARVYEEVL